MSESEQSSPTLENGESDLATTSGLEAYFSQSEQAVDQNETQEESAEVVEDSEPVLSQDQDSEAETESEAEAEAEAEDEVEEEPQSLKDLEYPKFKKRVDQLSKQKHELREEIDKLQEQLAEIKSGQAKQEKKPQTSDPIDNINTIDEVDAELERAESVIDWCDANEDGAVVLNDSGDEEELDSEEIRTIRKNAERMLRRLPKKAKAIQQRMAIDKVAHENYSWLADPKSAEFAEAQAVVKAFPELLKLPEASIVLGDLIEGRKARHARTEAKKKPAKASPRSPAKIAPSQPKVTAAPSAPKNARAQDAYASFAKSGGREDELVQLFKNL